MVKTFKKLYSINDVAKIAGVPKTTVAKWLRSPGPDSRDGYTRKRFQTFGKITGSNRPYLTERDINFFVEYGEIYNAKKAFHAKWKNRIVK
jgi:hypothetical protein